MSFIEWLQAQLPNRSTRKSSVREHRDASKRDRSLRIERLEDRFALACAAAPCWMEVTLSATDMSGEEITSIEPGGDFNLQATVSDLRVHPDGFNPGYPPTAPIGTFASYSDVTFDSSLVAPDRTVSYGPLLKDFLTPNEVIFATPGLLDEIGAAAFSAFATGTPSPSLLFSVPFTASAAGEVNFVLDPADNLPAHFSLLFGFSGPVPLEKIDFVNFTITVAAPSVEDQILQLTEQVDALISSGVLNEGHGNALTSKLQNAIQSINQGNNTAGINQIEAFTHQVNAFLNSGTLTDEQAELLIDAADQIIASALG